MTVVLGPVLSRIGSQIGPIILSELVKPRTRKFLRKVLDEGLGQALKFGKRRLGTRPRKQKGQFIMRRGRQRFQCRKVR